MSYRSATLKGGTIGGFAGLALGTLGVSLAQRRYPAFRSLTLPLKAFLVTSSGTFAGIISADHYSRQFETSVNVQDQIYQQRQEEQRRQATEGLSWTEKVMRGVREERYKIVGGSWVASMIAAFALVGRNPYLSGQQKLVQARVYAPHSLISHKQHSLPFACVTVTLIYEAHRYAQGLTLAVLVASAALEISEQNREKELGVQPHEENREGDDMWKSMVEAEEERVKERDEYVKRKEAEDRKNKKQHKKSKKPHVEEAEPSEESDEMPEKFIAGKKGEGKMMRKTTDKPGGAEGGVP